MHILPRVIVPLLAIFIAVVVGPASQVHARPAGVSVDTGYLVDPTQSLDLAGALSLAPDHFQHRERPDFTFGYTRDAVWIRVVVQADRDRAMLLSLSPSFVDVIDIYVAPLRAGLAAGDFRHIATGDHRPIPPDGFSGLTDAAELDLKAGTPMVAYVRIAAGASPLLTAVRVVPKETWPAHQAVIALLVGGWFGAAAVLVIIQLIFYYYDRRPRYILLAASTFMAVVSYTGTLGVARLLLFRDGGAANDIFVSTSLWLLLSASALAAAFILDLRDNSRWLYRIFLAGAVVGLVGAGFGLAGSFFFFAPIARLAVIALATLSAVQAVRTAGADGAATQLRAAAYVVLWVGVAAVTVQRTALLNLPTWIAHTHAVACLLQAILLTAALGVRLRAAETLNRVMQRDALLAARAAEEHANALVEERTRELATARQTAEDALQAELRSQQQQVRFMEVISHQYRTPLAAIRTYIDNIGLSLPEEDVGNRGRLDRVRNGIKRLVEVLEVNLSRARLQGPAFRPILRELPIAEIVQAAAVRGRDLLQSAVVADVTPEAARAWVRADADMLGIAIINLVENGEKFSRSRTREPILIFCRVSGGQVIISVTDKGIGIPAADLPTIFSPTRRGANAQGIEGTGMGLSLVARVVAAHGGMVHAESVEGQGTTVTISLPAFDD